MPLHLTPLVAAGDDRDQLVSFLTRNVFPFHVRARSTVEQVRAAIDGGEWGGDETEALWIDDAERGRLGVVRLLDLADPTAMVDLRLGEPHRGFGFGVSALTAAADRVFREHPGVARFEGQTREDNIAMRRTFERGGWVFEAHYRDGWPVTDGAPVASVAYSVLRRDWANGTTTPVPCGAPSAVRETRPRDVEALIAATWDAEERLLTPAVRGDATRLRELLAEDFVEIGQSGRRWTRDEIVAALASAPGRGDVEISEREARQLAPGLLLLHYRLRFEGRDSRRTSIWRGDPEPRCVFHQGTPVP
ncbi:MAG: hypothetical protein BGO45_13810 [Microbacterium sp. 71-36]|mgnify:FL=1|uniref:GNAT family N-acetyltransferase n=1 Tax=unclassified Microbacterium TaxID=2609290 RepID=UPI00086F2C33|nr:MULTISPECIES: GNAT family N-acetyltransferase [unclassified Microbacterium]ODT41937.1 MAG: hypothetical protein ABS60_01765 [Microbacterium sp. SCN 71-17]OJV77791.1 MAG: hypothetical protein BGO45_13810 [Microbacterium sp. 71-36]